MSLGETGKVDFGEDECDPKKKNELDLNTVCIVVYTLQIPLLVIMLHLPKINRDILSVADY